MTVQQQPPRVQQSAPASPQTPTAPPNSINVNKLGFFLDGWAELIEGMGGKASQVRSDVLNQLKERTMPEISLENKIGYTSLMSKERRDYVVAKTNPGACTTIYIAQHGMDLYASWRTWLEPKFNMKLLKWVIGGAAVLGLLTGGFDETGFSFTDWFIDSISFLLIACLILVLAGRILKGGFLAYFLIETNVFDAEDITAMSLSVHKSIIRSLDSAGIDVSKLRLKQTFKGGRRGEEV